MCAPTVTPGGTAWRERRPERSISGFDVMHSMVFNQIGGMLALGNGLLPLRKAAALRKAKGQHAHHGP
jgi:hypothetical protein